MTLIELIGLAAPVCFLTAYALVSSGRWASDAPYFHLCNIAGAALVLLTLSDSWNLPVFLLESAWCITGVIGLIRSLRRRRG